MSINRRMDKEDVVHIQNGILLSHKKELNWSFAEKWLDQKSVIQSEVSQKTKSKYHVITHIRGNQKNGIDDIIWKAEIETQTQRTNVWAGRGERGGWDELEDWD